MTFHDLIDYWKIKQELTVLVRNGDIFTITQRGVTTQQDTGTFSTTSTHTLATTPTTVKNVRNIEVGSADLTLWTDYSVNYDTGVITFVAAQTGAYVIDYDTGSTDKIFPDFPKTELKISSFPRISLDILDVSTEIGGFGNVNKNNIDFTVIVYATSIEDINNYLTAIRSLFINNRADLRQQLGIIRPIRTGPILTSPNIHKGTKVFQQNIDFRGILKYEVV